MISAPLYGRHFEIGRTSHQNETFLFSLENSGLRPQGTWVPMGLAARQGRSVYFCWLQAPDTCCPGPGASLRDWGARGHVDFGGCAHGGPIGLQLSQHTAHRLSLVGARFLGSRVQIHVRPPRPPPEILTLPLPQGPQGLKGEQGDTVVIDYDGRILDALKVG